MRQRESWDFSGAEERSVPRSSMRSMLRAATVPSEYRRRGGKIDPRMQ